jgi:alkylhydroperoxidase/carboxymuconolactone decarboxylase family protein YurZ
MGDEAMAADARQASDQQQDRLRGFAQGDQGAVADMIRIEVAASGIDARTHALCNLASLITTGLPDPANYVLHVARCLDAGCSADEVIGTMVAITPNVGMIKMVAAAPLIAAALDIDVPTPGDGGGAGGRFQRGGADAGAGASAGAGAGAGAAGAPGGTGGAGGG